MKTSLSKALPCMAVILAVTASGTQPALAHDTAKPCVVANYQNAKDACPPNVKPVKSNRHVKLSFNLSKLSDLPRAIFGKKEEPQVERADEITTSDLGVPDLPTPDSSKKSRLADINIREAELPESTIPVPKKKPINPIPSIREPELPIVATPEAKEKSKDLGGGSASSPSDEQNVVTAQILNPTFNLRTQPNIKSKSRGLVGKVIGQDLEIDTSTNDPDWVRVTTSAGDGWVNRQAFKPARIKGDFIIRSEPSLSGGKRLGLVKDALNTDDLVVTGRQKTTGSGSRLNTFMEVIYNGKPAWIHSTAFLDEAPEEAVVTASTKSTEEVPEAIPERKTEKDDEKSTTVGKVTPELKPASSPQANARTTRCVSTKAALDRNEELKKALAGTNPFTTWNGPWGAKVIVHENGTATLQHPIKGDIQFKASVCMDSKKAAYLSVNGQAVYLQGPKLELATFTQDGKQYKFRRAVK